jgi:hypothetical protein
MQPEILPAQGAFLVRMKPFLNAVFVEDVLAVKFRYYFVFFILALILFVAYRTKILLLF